MWRWILRVWSDGRNMELDQFIDVGPQGRDLGFTIAAHIVLKDAKSLCDSLASLHQKMTYCERIEDA